jgi:DNA-binding NtrC family response regulator
MSTLHVLLVESELALVATVRKHFAMSREPAFVIHHVSSLADACARTNDRSFDAIVTDLRLRDAYGFEILDRLVDSSPSPIIVLGAADLSLARQAIRHCAQDYLFKGRLEPHGLICAVLFAIERQRRDLPMFAAENFAPAAK